MFIRLFSRFMAPEPAPGGGTGAPPAPEAVKPDDARTYLADFVHDSEGLKTMDDAKVVELHGKVTGSIKKHSETLAKTEFEKRTRPEHIPEQFWDAEKREIKHDAMAKSWQDFRTASKNPQSAAPKTPDEYTFTPPEKFELAKDDKILPAFRKVAHEAGLSNEQFGKLAAGMAAAGVLQPEAMDVKKEMEKLGPMADAIVAINQKWGQQMVDAGVWTKEDQAEIMILGSSAEGVRALNKLREYYGGEKIPTGGDTGQTVQTQKDWYAKRNAIDPVTKKLRIEVDAEYRRQSDEDAKRIFGTEPARSSLAGVGMPS